MLLSYNLSTFQYFQLKANAFVSYLFVSKML